MYFPISKEGFLIVKDKIYVPNNIEIRLLVVVLKEVHDVPYVSHLKYQKTLTTLRKQFFWEKTKKGVTKYVVGCLKFHKQMQNLNIPSIYCGH